MKLSHGTRIKDITDSNGYGYATINMIESLGRLGYEISQNDPTADAEIWFDQPKHWEFSEGPYKIGYHPWESTLLLDDWAEIMNECDEIWTPSPLIAKWYQQYAGINVPVYTYEHGVDKCWTAKERKVEDKFMFLHCGAESARKGGSETMRAFRAAFPNNNDVGLTMKVVQPWFKINSIGRTNIVNGRLPLHEMIDLFHSHHAYVYPSHGEGFGLTPLQALATGMPTITLPAWAPYRKFLDKNISIGSRLVKSQWHRTLHPGKMYKPKFDDIVEAMRHTYDNYEQIHKNHLAQADAVKAAYDWDDKTKSAFEGLQERLEKR